MNRPLSNEARITEANNILIVLSPLEGASLLGDFCGATLTAEEVAAQRPDLAGKTVYLCGDLARADALPLAGAERVRVIEGLASGEGSPDWAVVGAGEVPLRVHGVGVLYRRFFDPGGDHFRRVCAEHAFQSLTESTKPGTAHRTGIYLSPVAQEGEGLRFQLLRCSTNLSGPTENFRATDRHIVDALNQEAARIFEGAATLNHVLAQIYPNTPATESQKQTKARIKAHADKTKDMPEDGVMAFCTFYDGLDALTPLAEDAFDLGYKNTSALTRLHFRLKKCVAERPDNTLPASFAVTLYPGSVFFMPLSTNRWYTHEIRPSMLDAARLPTRMGYVVRCSATAAVHRDGQTFIEAADGLRPLQPPTPEGMRELRTLYAEENRYDHLIDYGGRFLFSMNKGDYTAPGYHPRDELRCYSLPETEELFAALLDSAPFEAVTGGRQGAVLVQVDPARGTPIVRTTTRYDTPAQRFLPIHRRLAQRIQRLASLPQALNNALIERYTNDYAKMGAHSDQALDLAEGSAIAIFSCYKHPDRATPPRKLVVEPKAPGSGEAFEIPLTHNSVVVFSLDTNRRFRHKIVLDRAASPPPNEWLGVTFRTSATFVQHRGDGEARLASGAPLRLASDTERRDFYRLRGRENREPGFVYPDLDFTISPSDLLPPR